MIRFRGVEFSSFVTLVVRVWHSLSGDARTQRVEDEVRFELLKGLVNKRAAER
jgi:hypothetical protein